MPRGWPRNANYGRFTARPWVELAAGAARGRSGCLSCGRSVARDPRGRSRAGPPRAASTASTRVYSLVPRQLLTRDGLFMAAVLACGPGAVLSHRSAAALHELSAPGGVEHRRHGSRRARIAEHDGIDVHRSTTLTAADVTIVDSIPVHDRRPHASRPRRQSSTGAASSARCDQAEITEVFDLAALARPARPQPDPRRGAGRLRAVLADALPSARTPTVERARGGASCAICRAARPPRPGAPTRSDRLPRRRARRSGPTSSGASAALVVETDGGKWHTAPAGVRARPPPGSAADSAAGWRVIRITWQPAHRGARAVAARSPR